MHARYDALMDVVRSRVTNRAFAPGPSPRAHFEVILEAARPAKTAPGLIVIVADCRFVRAFPVLNDGSGLDRLYHQNAERILLQSAAASTMSAHLAAAALGYAVWRITAIGQDDIQKVKPLWNMCRDETRVD